MRRCRYGTGSIAGGTPMRTPKLARVGRLLAVLVSATMLLLVAAPAALGKEGVSVDLAAPLPGDAQPGTTVAALFTMSAISDDVVSPLTKASVFIRLFGQNGAMTEAVGVEQKTPGVYKAMVEIPAGGVTDCWFGIHGQAKTPSGKVVATDPIWQYDGLVVGPVVPKPADPNTNQTGVKPAAAPVAAPPVAATTPATQPAAAVMTIDPRLAAMIGVGLAALAVAAAVGFRRRRHEASTAA